MKTVIAIFLFSLVFFSCNLKRDNHLEQTKSDTNISLPVKSRKKITQPDSTRNKTVDAIDSIDSETAKLYSGVYRGIIHTFATCDSDTALANIYFDLDISPFTIIYDGTVYENASLGDFGRFNNENGIIKFVYNGSVSNWYEPENNEMIDWIKIDFTRSLKKKHDEYLIEHKNYLKFWEIFEEALMKKDFETVSSFANYPIVDLTGEDKNIRNKEQLYEFFKANQSNFNESFKYKNKMQEPTRFTDSDTCFPKEYIWLITSPYLVFKYINGKFKITSLRSFG